MRKSIIIWFTFWDFSLTAVWSIKCRHIRMKLKDRLEDCQVGNDVAWTRVEGRQVDEFRICFRGSVDRNCSHTGCRE